jgi:uncharacterized protein (DUF3084 family)
MIHLLLMDQGICYDTMPATERGAWISDRITAQLRDFSVRLHLNNQNCFFKLIENFVKVAKMEQMLEDYRAELERLRQEKERERQEKLQALQELTKLKRQIAALKKKKK